MIVLLHILGGLTLVAGLIISSYLDLIYRERGRVTPSRIHTHLDIFESEIEPRLRIEPRRGGLPFSLLSDLFLAAVVLVTAHGIVLSVVETWQVAVELAFFVSVEVVMGMYLFPHVLLARTTGRWLRPLLPIVRIFLWLVWPLAAGIGFVISVAHLSDEETSRQSAEGQGIEALVEAAREGGILEKDEAQLIEQVVEFSDKQVREVMTPRPDVVAIPAAATIEELRRVLVQTKFSRLPVYEGSLDEILGIVYARDILQVPEREATQRTVRELMRPALFVPEAKLGSQLLKEMQSKNQQMAIVIDEYGLLAGVVTVEDLVEEIVGEIGEEDRPPAPDVVRETADSMVLRGSVSVEKLQELFGVEFESDEAAPATTVAGLLNSLAGHVPASGETIEHNGLRFEVLEANQRKVLRLRARRLASAAARRAELA